MHKHAYTQPHACINSIAMQSTCIHTYLEAASGDLIADRLADAISTAGLTHLTPTDPCTGDR